MSDLEKKALEIADEIQNGLAEAGPLVFKAIWLDGLLTITSGLALAGLAFALWSMTKKYARKAGSFDNEPVWIVGGGLSALLGFLSIFKLVSASAWIAVLDPKAALVLYIARRLAG